MKSVLLALVLGGSAVHAATPTANLLAAPDDDWQIKLDLARRLRSEKNFAQATQTLVTMLDKDAAEPRLRVTLLELAATAQEAGQPARAVQVLAQYLERFPQDPSAPDILLRQGLLYRDMGATAMALAKFYGVMTTTLNLKLDGTGYYQRLVLQAQTEIAETYYRQGEYGPAADFFERLLKLETTGLNRAEIQLRLLRSLGAAGQHAAVIERIRQVPANVPVDSEIRYLLVRALQETGQKDAAVAAVLQLLATPDSDLWARRAGNELANHLYTTGDFPNALAVYQALTEIDPTPQWRVPVLYQMGLTYERLRQPAEAAARYAAVGEYGAKLGPQPSVTLKTVLDLAAWRKNHLAWQSKTAPPTP